MDYSPIISPYKWARTTITYSYMLSLTQTYEDVPDYESFMPVADALRAEIDSILNPGSASNTIRPAYFSDVTPLKFSLVSTTGDIAIGSHNRDATQPAAAFPPDGSEYGGDIWLGLDFTEAGPVGSHKHFALVHEIGHALGLEHGNVYPPSNSPTTMPNLSSEFDNMKYTVMSYNLDPDGGASYPVGLQQFDIAALQEMYGVNYSTRSGDTIYIFDTSPGILTIWDGGGTDTIDTQRISGNVMIDLQPGHFSSIGGTKNVAMALVSHLTSENQIRPLIENVQTGAGNDVLIGNDAKNLLRGGGGANKLSGLNGDGILLSEGNGDFLDGGKGNDALINLEQDGNTTYVFGKGYGHDGIYDNPFDATNVDLILKDVSASDIEITFWRYDQNNSRPPEEQTPEPAFAYRVGVLKILSSGDTLILPWIYREGAIKDFFGYAEDSIIFGDGQVWNVSDIENHSILETITTEAEFTYLDPVLLAFASEEVMQYIPVY
jgi:hypothetical protein